MTTEPGELQRFCWGRRGMLRDPDGHYVTHAEHIADRASRQVANKAEVDLSSLNAQTGADIELVYCNRDEEFVRLDDVKALLATPPATTGASKGIEMSNPTELPDLDSMKKVITEALGNTHIEDGTIAAFDQVVDDLARAVISAQPEGEAPQAVAQVEIAGNLWRDVEVADLPKWDAALFPHRTLYTAPAAQHAESDAQAAMHHDPALVEAYNQGYEACLAAQQAAAPGALAERDPSKPAEQQGLFRKFDVRRTDGSDAPGGKHHGCRYYVLDLTHDQHAPAAMRAYAAACAVTHPLLAADIAADFGTAPSAPGAPEAPGLPGQSDEEAYASSGYRHFMSLDTFKAFRRECENRATQLDGGQEGSESNG